MRKAYLLIYGNDAGTREQVRAWADKCPLVLTWRYDLPNCFYLISEQSEQELAENFYTTFSDASCLCIEIADHYWGRLAPETWYLIKHKYHQPKKP